MRNLIAIHEIHRDGPKGSRRVEAPGTSFTAEDTEGDFLIQIGAARLDPAAVAPAATAPAPTKGRKPKASDADPLDDNELVV